MASMARRGGQTRVVLSMRTSASSDISGGDITSTFSSAITVPGESVFCMSGDFRRSSLIVSLENGEMPHFLKEPVIRAGVNVFLNTSRSIAGIFPLFIHSSLDLLHDVRNVGLHRSIGADITRLQCMCQLGWEAQPNYIVINCCIDQLYSEMSGHTIL